MSWGAPPSGKHNEGVVDSDPEKEERGGEVQRDELHLQQRDEDLDEEDLEDEDQDEHNDNESDPQIAGESESSKDGKDGGEEAEETDQWLRAHLER